MHREANSIERGVVAVLIDNDHPANIGAVVLVIDRYTDSLPVELKASECYWIVEAATPLVAYDPQDTNLTEIRGRMGDHLIARQEALLVLKFGPNGAAMRWTDEPGRWNRKPDLRLVRSEEGP